ncbi:MAG: hypothetical protein S4CHLAM2_07650 [Chlamydiales bacterium]|nr:hypothetical protein [Chlamydiales bacterium]
MRKRTIFLILGGLVAVGAAVWVATLSRVEQAEYTVVEKHGTIELRDYGPLIVAEVETTGTREAAISEGFRLLAEYIFGNNSAVDADVKNSENIEMTAPVIQKANKEIAMTAPVIQNQQGEDIWITQFVMPKSYTLKTLPKPTNPAVVLKEIPQRRFAVIRFSGRAHPQNLQENTEQLERFIVDNQLQPLSTPAYAFFNPPWTPPFLRRNEVMIEIAHSK